ncbi:helix-turn-helix domain-containing protein [Carnobacteriaceae bacterium zg-84]|nr:helix-turn-helix domain-containing protein [Granulicatella sp. zg-84]QMI86221.1 helix-turn-helix domain-containing protein [Carnobacteriaceae bacterium zg-84]
MKIRLAEEMRFHQKVVKFTIKHKNNEETVRKYKISR